MGVRKTAAAAVLLLLLSAPVAAQQTGSGGIIDGVVSGFCDTTKICGSGSGGTSQAELGASYYSLPEIWGTGNPEIGIRGKLYLESGDYSGVNCYWTEIKEDGQELKIQEAGDRSKFPQVKPDAVGDVKFYVPAPESEVGKTYRVISQCFKNGKATNIIKAKYTTRDQFEDSTAYAADVAQRKRGKKFGVDGEPLSGIEGEKEKAVQQTIDRTRFENARISSCSISPRILSTGEKFTVKVDIENLNDHPLKYSVAWPIEKDNLKKEFEDQSFESVSAGSITPGKTGVVEGGETVTVQKTGELEDAEGRGQIELLGKRTHELLASVGGPDSPKELSVRLATRFEDNRPLEGSSGTVSCGYFTLGSSLNPKGTTRRTSVLVEDSSYREGESESQNPTWMNACRDKVSPGDGYRKIRSCAFDLGAMCVGTRNPGYACTTILKSLCLDSGGRFNKKEMRCEY